MDRGSRIVVLAKPPLIGRCKSRLAADIGHGRATRLARAFLADTWSAISAFVSARPQVDLMLAQAGEPHEFPLLLPAPGVVRQGSGDLGRRMATLIAGGLDQPATHPATHPARLFRVFTQKSQKSTFLTQKSKNNGFLPPEAE